MAAKSEERKFGQSVAISGNGEFALIGDPGGQSGSGAAWVFKRAGSRWVEQGPPLTVRGQGASHRFGESVALSANGEIALVGAPREQGAGEAWVFKRSGSKWAQQGGALRTGKRLGEAVALSGDGAVAFVSATDHGTSSAGVFERSNSNWAQGGELTAGVEGTVFGSHAALSANGELALLSGASGPDGENAVWTFKRSGSEWVQQGPTLTVSGENGRGFGTSVALSANGSMALIGGSFASGGGAAWAFRRSGALWAQRGGTLTGAAEGQGANALFGSAAALSADGKVALIGAPGVGGRGPRRRSPTAEGAAWAFEWLHGAWSPVGGKLTPPNHAIDARFGYSVALSDDGDRALVGSANGGTVRVFERSAPHGAFRSRGALAPPPERELER